MLISTVFAILTVISRITQQQEHQRQLISRQGMTDRAQTKQYYARSPPTVLILEMRAITFFSRTREANPRLIAVVAMPVPSGFVKMSRSPGRAFAFVVTRRTSTIPVTAKP